MNNKRNLNDTKDNSKDNLRISIISALVALSIAVLAIFHDNNIILGQIARPESFIITIINALKLFLYASIISGIIYLLTTGYLYGFSCDEKYDSEVMAIKHLVIKWHSFILWLHKKSYGLTIEIFILSFISIAFNMVAKMLGFYGVGSLIVATAITAIIIIVAFAILLYKRFMNRKLTKK